LFELFLMVGTIIAVTLIWMSWAPGVSSLFGYLLLFIPGFSMLRDILRWNTHQYVVTNRRVVQIFGLFNKNVTDSSLEKVNDVRMDQSFWGRIFNFGDIEILTASELGINRFTFIGDPIGFKTAMLNAKFRLEQNGDGYVRSAPVETIMDVPRLIQDLDELRKTGLISDAEFMEKKNKLLTRI
jgi:uncharacterized membrane protein YdbT with pleckstrin-like domain